MGRATARDMRPGITLVLSEQGHSEGSQTSQESPQSVIDAAGMVQGVTDTAGIVLKSHRYSMNSPEGVTDAVGTIQKVIDIARMVQEITDTAGEGLRGHRCSQDSLGVSQMHPGWS